jgi:hypothetical protein
MLPLDVVAEQACQQAQDDDAGRHPCPALPGGHREGCCLAVSAKGGTAEVKLTVRAGSVRIIELK